MRESWTDERLDDFRGEVNRRFDEVDRRFDRVDERFEKVDERFEKVDERFEEVNRRMDAGFNRINDRIDGLERAFMQIGFVLVAALIGLIATQL